MSLLLGGGEFGPDQMPVVWAEVTACDGALRGALDGYAVDGTGESAPRLPVANGGLANAKRISKLAHAASVLNREVYGFHADMIT